MPQPSNKRLVTEASLPEAVRTTLQTSLLAGDGVEIEHDGDLDTVTIGALTPVITRFLTPGTDMPYPVPPGAKAFFIRVLGPGGGAGSGRRGAAGTVRCGGGAGSNGALSEWLIPVEDLGGAETLYVNLASPGVGGAAVTTDDTNGNAGTASSGASAVKLSTAGITVPNTLVHANGGLGGAGGSATAGAGGASTAGKIIGPAGASASATGGVGTNGGGSNGGPAGSSGSGGGLTAANAQSNGGAGGYSAGRNGSTVPGGVAPGGNGGNGANPPGLSGGQGASGGASSLTGPAGAGGNGGMGAGGAGGGASVNGNDSGKGGDGGPGFVEITAFM